MYTNERERRVDRRLAELEREVFGAPQGPDGTDRSQAPKPIKDDPSRPATYQPPKPGENLANR